MTVSSDISKLIFHNLVELSLSAIVLLIRKAPAGHCVFYSAFSEIPDAVDKFLLFYLVLVLVPRPIEVLIPQLRVNTQVLGTGIIVILRLLLTLPCLVVELRPEAVRIQIMSTEVCWVLGLKPQVLLIKVVIMIIICLKSISLVVLSRLH